MELLGVLHMMSDGKSPDPAIRQTLEHAAQLMSAYGETFEVAQQQFSKLLFARYRSLVDAGFTEAQAFEIVKLRALG